MNRQELNRIGNVLNCGGEGGTPGPCPISGGSAVSSSQDRQIRGDPSEGKSYEWKNTSKGIPAGSYVKVVSFKKQIQGKNLVRIEHKQLGGQTRVIQMPEGAFKNSAIHLRQSHGNK